MYVSTGYGDAMEGCHLIYLPSSYGPTAMSFAAIVLASDLQTIS